MRKLFALLISFLLAIDVKKLQGKSDDYRLKVGDYRVIFSKNDRKFTIKIIEIASRGEVYKRI
jgi:mRNA interferase RelE/StbE